MTGRQPDNPARRRDPSNERGWLVAALVLTAVLVLIGLLRIAARLMTPDWDPRGIEYVTTYPARAWLAAIPMIVGVAALVAAAGWVLRPRRGATRVDAKAASMARPKDLDVMHGAAARDDAARLGSSAAADAGPPIARLLPGRQMLHASWEWVQVWIMGPRAGKTSCVCVPQVLHTAGPVLGTTNKRDLVDQTRGPRSELGHVWVFDPQDIIGEPAGWWWDPLSFVTDLQRAEQLAELFAASARDEGAKTDAYFDTEAQNYLALILYAAALSKQPITRVHEWMTMPSDETPVLTLRMAGEAAAANALNGIINLTERQRDGVVGTARKMVAWLTNRHLLQWITDDGTGRPHFDPAAFVTTRQSLFLVSREGQGTTRAITAALTVATITEAEKIGARSPQGRLPVPLTVVLDEAANVVRWPQLPDLYSHFGSRGIVVSTFLQSWNQGVAVWGRDGMEKLWSAANVRVVGAGVAQADFMGDLSVLIGDHDVIRRDTSTSGAGSRGLFDGSSRSVSTRVQRERIFEAADLTAMPRGRAVMLSSGAPAALLELRHWSELDQADAITASEQHYTAQIGAQS